MILPQNKKTTVTEILTFALLGALVGILLIFLNTSFLLNVVFVIMGIVTVLFHIPGLTVGLMSLHTRDGQISLVLSLISIAVGVLLIFWHTSVLMLILGIYMIVLPIVQILLSKDKLPRLRTELPKLIVGVVLVLIGPAKALDVVFDIAGWIVLALTAIYVIVMLIGLGKASQSAQTTGNRIFVDTTGDGKVDTVYVDTTGDGKPDTATQYRENP